ncbi:MAG: hypothetical protein IKC61_02475 [Clostridia bacterium]|nr:hypothetical protein [Clostridia bacterium]
MKQRIHLAMSYLRRNRIATRLLSAALSFVLLFYVIPSTIYAEIAEAFDQTDSENYAINNETAINDLYNEEYKVTAENVLDEIIYEATELREENVKHFRLSDGSYLAAQYNSPVHVLDEYGQWQDIDNSLSESGGEYSNASASVKFAKKITGNHTLFTLHDGDTKITLSLIDAVKGTVGSVKNNSDAEETTKLQKMINLEKLSSSIMYKDILDGTDLEYVVYSKNVKENIIVKEKKDSYSYTFDLKLNGLTPALTESGDILLTDDLTGEVKYTIPAPVVFDSNKCYAPDGVAEYSLTHTNGERYVLEISVNAEWMNAQERAFPVTVDPTVKSDSMVSDTYIDIASPTTPNSESDTLLVKSDPNALCQAYLKFLNLPNVPLASYITHAELFFTATPATSEASYVGVYEVMSNWFPNLTWEQYDQNNGSGKLNSIPIDYAIIDESGPISFDLTEFLSKWYYYKNSGYVEQDGLAIAPIPGYAANVTLDSMESGEATRPTLFITYKDMKGIESYWQYSSHSTEAGTGSVNLANGNLVFSIPTLSATDNLFGFTPTLVYNSAMFYLNYMSYTVIGTAYNRPSAAYGFKINACESIIEKISRINPDEPERYYIYADSDGSEHEFHLDSENRYTDADGLGLELQINEDSLVIIDSSKTVRRFLRLPDDVTGIIKSRWCLSEIEDVNGNKLVFSADAYKRPTSIGVIPNGANESIELLKLFYNSKGILCAVYNPESRHSVILKYSSEWNYPISYNDYSNYLRRVEYCYGTDATTENDVISYATTGVANANVLVHEAKNYNYDELGKLTEVINVTTDTSLRYTWDGHKIVKVSEYAGTTLGQEVEMVYGGSYTEVRSSGNDEILHTDDDILTYYVFDSTGRATSIYSRSADSREILGGVTGTYDTQEESKNSITEEIVLGYVRNNLLVNGDFTYPASDPLTLPYWTASGASRVNGNCIEDPSTLTVGFLVNKFAPAYISQRVSLEPGNYAFSMQYESKNCTNVDGLAEFIDSESGNVLHSEIIKLNETDTAKRGILLTSFSLDYAAEIDVKISVTGKVGMGRSVSVYIGKLKLEKGRNSSAYNLVNDSSFTSGIGPGTKWNAYNQGTVVETDADGNKYVVLTASGGTNLLKQQVFARTPAELENLENNAELISSNARFMISGYAKADTAVPEGEFRLYAEVIYMRDGSYTSVIYPADFTRMSGEWQFASATFSLNKDANGDDIPPYLCVSAIYIVCDYSGQIIGTAAFDDISLTYVEEEQRQDISYSDGLPTKVIDGFDEVYYSYNSDGNVVRMADNKGKLIEYVYGANPNVVIRTEEYEYELNDGVSVYPFDSDTPDAYITKTYKSKTEYTYNSYGMITEVVWYEILDGDPNTTGNLSRQTYTYEVTPTSKIFGTLLSERSADSEYRYFYDSSTGWLLASLDIGSNNGYSYTYDEVGRLLKVEPAIYNSSSDTYSGYTTNTKVEYDYDIRNRLSGISTDSTEYTLTYDIFGNSESISIGSRVLAEYEYNDNNGKIKKIVYGNGYEVEYVYNDLEQLEAIRHKADENAEYVTAYEYEYNSDGQPALTRDNINGIVLVYKYDVCGKLIGYGEYTSDDYDTVTDTYITYDDHLRVSRTDNIFSYTGGTDTVTSSYTYLPDGKLQGYTVDSGFNLSGEYIYDSLDRISEVVYNVNEDELTISESYTYATDSVYGASGHVTRYTYNVGSQSTAYTYTYNDAGYITKIRYNAGGQTVTYTYDGKGQLIGEDNDITGYTYTYTYDAAGNLTRVSYVAQSNDGFIQMGSGDTSTTFALTPLLPNLPVPTVNTYTYSDSEWGDLLTKYNGVSITYDEIGNPLSYYNGSSYTFSWQGRKLIGAVKGTNTMSFEYDIDGLRISKTTNGVTTHYVYNGELLLAEYTDTTTVVYIYDANGAPIGFKCRLNTYEQDVWDIYWYGKNLQGDIASIYDSTGTELISYTYTAWGTTTKDYYNNGANTTAVHNNLTYRGYYYDSDLGMYYLQSRYYDPAICRFINADSYVSTGQGINSYNMFAYCGNNPIMYVDPTGEFPVLAILIIAICTVVGGIVGYQVANNVEEERRVQQSGETEDQKLGDDVLDISNEEYKMPTWEKIGYIAGGALMGTATSGAVLMISGAGGTLLTRSTSKLIAGFSMTGPQLFALGASVSDIALTLVSPFLNIDIELVEYPESQYKNAPTYMP